MHKTQQTFVVKLYNDYFNLQYQVKYILFNITSTSSGHKDKKITLFKKKNL